MFLRLTSSSRPRVHLFGESNSVVNALEQSATPGSTRCSDLFMNVLTLDGPRPPSSEAPPLLEGPLQGQPTWDLL